MHLYLRVVQIKYALVLVVVVCQKFVASHLPDCLKLSENLDVDYGKDDYSLLISLGSSNKLVLFSSFFCTQRDVWNQNKGFTGEDILRCSYCKRQVSATSDFLSGTLDSDMQ